jgi:hypothetical protein
VIAPYFALRPEAAAIEAAVRRFQSVGCEGAVLRTHDSTYRPAHRSRAIFKVVPWRDHEYRILRVIRRTVPPAQRHVLSKVQAVECVTDSGRTFRAQVKLPPSVANAWADLEGDTVGLFATVQAPRLTADGVPRFGQVKCIRGGSGQFV